MSSTQRVTITTVTTLLNKEGLTPTKRKQMTLTINTLSGETKIIPHVTEMRANKESVVYVVDSPVVGHLYKTIPVNEVESISLETK